MVWLESAPNTGTPREGGDPGFLCALIALTALGLVTKKRLGPGFRGEYRIYSAGSVKARLNLRSSCSSCQEWAVRIVSANFPKI
jgi:hypothetical protein